VLTGVLAHLVVADRLQVVLVQEVEAKLFRLCRRVHLHGHADEPERDRSAPDRSHAFSLPRRRSEETRRQMFRVSADGRTPLRNGTRVPKSSSLTRGSRSGPAFWVGLEALRSS